MGILIHLIDISLEMVRIGRNIDIPVDEFQQFIDPIFVQSRTEKDREDQTFLQIFRDV